MVKPGRKRFDRSAMITIVSGLPRSGTSLMMQMLAAGGLAPLTDGIRAADADNPRGYSEWERIKQLPQDPALIAQAEGMLVKVISSLLMSLPVIHEYRIVFLRRPIQQVLASQAEMIRRRGGRPPGVSGIAMQAALETHLRGVTAWLKARHAITVHWVDFPDLIARPLESSREIAAFLGGSLDIDAMALEVDPSLFRHRI